jgi:hypothetical protein
LATFTLSDNQFSRAEALVDPALVFLSTRQHPLSEAIVRYHWRNGPAAEVISALATYQNDDGGFGKGLEVDIKAPVSNPFAARLAMQVMLMVPLDASSALSGPLKTWLVENQHDDGDWHFAPEVYESELAPWFAGWEFPALNPACCVAGLAHRLELTNPEMLDCVATLFTDKASTEEASGGEFYGMLPYVEYVESVDIPNREAYVDALAQGILKTDAEGAYADAQHFFDHAISAGPMLVERLPVDLLARWTDILLSEPSEDGGWPTPYDQAWRPWATASAMATLARLKHGL